MCGRPRHDLAWLGHGSGFELTAIGSFEGAVRAGMAGSSPTRCTHLVPQPDAKVAAGRPQSRIRVKLRAIGSIGRGSLHDTTSKTYACNQLKRRAIFRCVNLVGSSPAMTGAGGWERGR